MNLTMRELNQILAALRFWQRKCIWHFGRSGPEEEEAIFFKDDLKPLDEDEIDGLYEKINQKEEIDDDQEDRNQFNSEFEIGADAPAQEEKNK